MFSLHILKKLGQTNFSTFQQKQKKKQNIFKPHLGALFFRSVHLFETDKEGMMIDCTYNLCLYISFLMEIGGWVEIGYVLLSKCNLWYLIIYDSDIIWMLIHYLFFSDSALILLPQIITCFYQVTEFILLSYHVVDNNSNSHHGNLISDFFGKTFVSLAVHISKNKENGIKVFFLFISDRTTLKAKWPKYFIYLTSNTFLGIWLVKSNFIKG